MVTGNSAPVLWRWLEKHPWLTISGLVAAQHGLLLGARGLWWADEARHGGVLLDMASRGAWFALRLNGHPYPDKPPLYFWFQYGLQRLFGAQDWVLFLGLALTVLALCLATHRLAMSLAGDRWVALCSVLVMTSATYFLMLSHYARMDFLFAALIVESWRGFLEGVRGPSLNRRSLATGFACAAAATMVKGPVGVLLPLAALVLLLVHRGRARQIADPAVLWGLVGVAAVVALWGCGILYFGGADFLKSEVSRQLLGRALDTRSGAWGYLRYLVTLPLVFLPWTLGPRLLRQGSAAGVDLMICLLGGLVVLSLIGEKHEYYLLPLLPLCAVLAALALQSQQRHAARLAVLLGGYCIVLGLGLAGAAPMAGLLGSALPPYAGDIAAALRWPGALILLIGGGLLALRRTSHEALILTFALSQTLFVNFAIRAVTPALSAVLSPATLTEAMRPALLAGYEPAVGHGIGGVFAHDFGRDYAQVDGAEPAAQWIAETPQAVVALTKSDWSRIAARFADVQVLACPSFLGRPFVVIAHPPLPGQASNGTCPAE